MFSVKLLITDESIDLCEMVYSMWFYWKGFSFNFYVYVKCMSGSYEVAVVKSDWKNSFIKTANYEEITTNKDCF